MSHMSKMSVNNEKLVLCQISGNAVNSARLMEEILNNESILLEVK